MPRKPRGSPPGRAVQSCMSHRLPVRASQPRPGAKLSPKCTGGLNVLLIKLQARRSGSVGTTRDWRSDALHLAPSQSWPSCGPAPKPPNLWEPHFLCEHERRMQPIGWGWLPWGVGPWSGRKAQRQARGLLTALGAIDNPRPRHVQGPLGYLCDTGPQQGRHGPWAVLRRMLRKRRPTP